MLCSSIQREKKDPTLRAKTVCKVTCLERAFEKPGTVVFIISQPYYLLSITRTPILRRALVRSHVIDLENCTLWFAVIGMENRPVPLYQGPSSLVFFPVESCNSQTSTVKIRSIVNFTFHLFMDLLLRS